MHYVLGVDNDSVVCLYRLPSGGLPVLYPPIRTDFILSYILYFVLFSETVFVLRFVLPSLKKQY